MPTLVLASTFSVNVFDCLISIPTSFVVNGHERNGVVLYQLEGLKGSRLRISDFEKTFGRDELLVVTTKRTGSIVLQEFRLEVDSGRREPIFRMHDGREQIAIYGVTGEFAHSLLEECIANPISGK
jgi:hypothetical protein